MINEELVKYKTTITDMLHNEKPQSILEISGYDGCLAEMITNNTEQGINIDRIDLSDGSLPIDSSLYRNIHDTSCFGDISKINTYDVIIIFHMFENIPADNVKSILIELLYKTTKCILAFTPMYPYNLESDSESEFSTIRVYNPIFFLGIEFNFIVMDEMQVYCFFPKIEYAPVRCDLLENSGKKTGKMKIAYILPHHKLTGGLKALLQQVKELKANGHTVNIYHRCDESERALPPWSHLTDDDVSSQIVIPSGDNFIDHLNDEEIIVIGFVYNASEFKGSSIPVVVWEQGHEMIYGDYNKLIYSDSKDRAVMHHWYRAPFHFLAVSETIRTVLKGVFNRESQLFPNGIDTDFYRPLEEKNNEIPVVLLVGNPNMEFKGFRFALAVLSAAVRNGVKFNVWWAAQADFTWTDGIFEIEKFIMPSQDKLAELYRKADVFLSTSLYESFPLPPFEAMASGTAVIATDNGGINTYAEPGVNCILCDQGDLNSMNYALITLLQNPEARMMLAKAGRETALKYTFKNIVPILEQCLSRIISGFAKDQ